MWKWLARFQEFFFDNVSVEDLNEKCLTVTVCHQSPQKLQKDVVIGDLYVPLKNLSELRSKKEVKIVEELKHRINPKVGIYYNSKWKNIIIIFLRQWWQARLLYNMYVHLFILFGQKMVRTALITLIFAYRLERKRLPLSKWPKFGKGWSLVRFCIGNHLWKIFRKGHYKRIEIFSTKFGDIWQLTRKIIYFLKHPPFAVYNFILPRKTFNTHFLKTEGTHLFLAWLFYWIIRKVKYYKLGWWLWYGESIKHNVERNWGILKILWKCRWNIIMVTAAD